MQQPSTNTPFSMAGPQQGAPDVVAAQGHSGASSTLQRPEAAARGPARGRGVVAVEQTDRSPASGARRSGRRPARTRARVGPEQVHLVVARGLNPPAQAVRRLRPPSLIEPNTNNVSAGRRSLANSSRARLVRATAVPVRKSSERRRSGSPRRRPGCLLSGPAQVRLDVQADPPDSGRASGRSPLARPFCYRRPRLLARDGDLTAAPDAPESRQEQPPTGALRSPPWGDFAR